jgi:hypothetical protein
MERSESEGGRGFKGAAINALDARIWASISLPPRGQREKNKAKRGVTLHSSKKTFKN